MDAVAVVKYASTGEDLTNWRNGQISGGATYVQSGLRRCLRSCKLVQASLLRDPRTSDNRTPSIELAAERKPLRSTSLLRAPPRSYGETTINTPGMLIYATALVGLDECISK